MMREYMQTMQSNPELLRQAQVSVRLWGGWEWGMITGMEGEPDGNN